MNVGQIIIWIIVGALAGNIAGWLVTFKKEGLGRWTNLLIGMIGALIGGTLVKWWKVDLGLGELNITFEDLLAAVLGSLIFMVAWWAIRRIGSKSKKK